MKKIIAVLLVLVSLFSMFAICASSEGVFDELINKEDENPLYIIIYKHYHSDEVMYMPQPTFSYQGPCVLKVTTDAPVAVNKEFQYWEDADGKTYRPGQEVYVEGEIHLYAVFTKANTPKDEPNFIGVIRSAIQSLLSVFHKILVSLHIVNP